MHPFACPVVCTESGGSGVADKAPHVVFSPVAALRNTGVPKIGSLGIAINIILHNTDMSAKFSGLLTDIAKIRSQKLELLSRLQSLEAEENEKLQALKYVGDADGSPDADVTIQLAQEGVLAYEAVFTGGPCEGPPQANTALVTIRQEDYLCLTCTPACLTGTACRNTWA